MGRSVVGPIDDAEPFHHPGQATRQRNQENR